LLYVNRFALAASLLLGSHFAALSAHAAAIQLFAPADLSPADTTMVYPGAPNTVLPSPLTLAADANTLTLISPFGYFRRSAQGTGFTADFLPNTPLLVPQSSSYLDITFASGITEAGLQVQTGYVSSFGSETLTAYNGSTTLGSWTISARNNGTGNGTAPFLGVRATDGDLITRLRVSNRVGGTELDYYFAVGPLTFAAASPQPVPEPTTILLFVVALLVLRLQRHRATDTAITRSGE